MKVLVTGFQPFGGSTVNPAYEAVKLLPASIGEAEIVKLELPVVLGEGGDMLIEAIEKERPDIVICVGQAGGRAALTVERVGINLRECGGFPDNAGNAPDGEKIREDGENAYFATVPVKAMVKRCREQGIPAALSYTAGSHVCNDVMYTLLYHLKRHHPDVTGGFIHVPFAIEQGVGVLKPASTPTMPVPYIAKGLVCCIEAAIAGTEETLADSGATH